MCNERKDGCVASDKKFQILETAKRQIRSLGLTRVNARSIAQELKIRSSLVFYYFPTQQQLISDVVANIVAGNASFVRQELDDQGEVSAYQMLKAYMRGNLRWGLEQPDAVAAIFYGLTEMKHDENMAKFFSGALLVGEKKVFDIIITGIGMKEWDAQVNPEEIAKTLHQMLFGCIANQYYCPNPDSLDDYLERIMRVARMLLIFNPNDAKNFVA